MGRGNPFGSGINNLYEISERTEMDSPASSFGSPRGHYQRGCIGENGNVRIFVPTFPIQSRLDSLFSPRRPPSIFSSAPLHAVKRYVAVPERVYGLCSAGRTETLAGLAEPNRIGK